MYDVHRLRLLRELHLRGTLAAVAAALGYSPSSISHQLSLLEREVGAALLEPHGRRVRLTAAAQLLVDHASAVLVELERAEAAMAALRGEIAGIVRVATFQTAAHTFVLDTLSALARDQPGVTVKTTQTDAHTAIPALQARDFDLALYEEYPHAAAAPQADIVTETIATDPLLLIVPPASSAASLAELADANWAAEPLGTPARAWMTLTCRAAGFEPEIALETTDVLLHARFVSRGLGVAFIPKLGFEAATSNRVIATGHYRKIGAALRRGSEGNPAIVAALSALRTSIPTAQGTHP